MKFIRSLYFNNRFYWILSSIILILVFGYFFDILFILGKIAILSVATIMVLDILLLYATGQQVNSTRECPEKLSNGDENEIKIYVKNLYRISIFIKVIDEIPVQFQIRDFLFQSNMKANEEKFFTYKVKPLKRGEYEFGNINIYVSSHIGFISKRYIFSQTDIVPVYPSFIQMRKYELIAISNKLSLTGIKKIRRIGRHMEFDKIRAYVKGDDYRTINWKATARKAELMVNQYQDERSQQVFSIIDMGRSMKMPFEGMTLLDYAINSSLVISNIAIHKHDKVGLITFTNKINSIIPADRKNNYILRFLETLYKQETDFSESNFEMLTAIVARRINERSLLFIYTNFESFSSLNRQIEYFKRLAKNHLLVVIFFENTEVREILDKNPHNIEDVYIKTIAEKFIYDKKLIVKELKKYGIHSILTEPQNLSVDTINKYLELKALGVI